MTMASLATLVLWGLVGWLSFAYVAVALFELIS